MSRNQEFRFRQPFNRHPSLKLHSSHGPFSFLNPTRARYAPEKTPVPTTDSEATSLQLPSADHDSEATKHDWSPMSFEWRSRDNRKGRHTIVLRQSMVDTDKYSPPAVTATLRATLSGIGRMLTYFPYWDISWLVAVIFTLGSVVWVINAFFVWLPLVRPSTEFEGEISVGGGWTAFIGATIFEVGSIFLILEAINENRAGCFGWALDKVLTDVEGKGKITLKPETDGCAHHHTNKKNFLGKGADPGSHKDLDSMPQEQGRDEKTASNIDKGWQWYPSWKDLTHHYIYELGFLACFFQLLGATIFWISGFTALPAIFEVLAENQNTLDGAYWVPQIIGGSGFIISSTFFMLETQEKWYKPALSKLGWHIGFWNLIGAFGFTLCGALGPAYLNSGAQFEASLATFWGSWAFLIGSLIQWYECLDTHPVEVIKES